MYGCSGSSSGTHRGQFVDSAVEGLTFETQTCSGTTDEEGSFLFSSGERVTFSVGGIVLGSTHARPVITPVDLVPGARDETNPAVINMARLLITLDQDRNPENGITIPQELADALAGMSVLFNQTPESFSQDPEVLAVLDAACEVYGASGGDGLTLCPQQDAMDHLARTLAELKDYTPDNDGNSGGGGGNSGGGGGG